MIVSLTIVRYKKWQIPFALLAMAILRLPLSFQKGCTFYKLMGSGKNGTFDTKPDWQQWALLAAWDTPASFYQFHNQSFIAFWWNFFFVEKWTVLLSPLQSHGKWDGKEPFGTTQTEIHDGPVAVLTRATIRFNKLKHFWANVDGVANLMHSAPGYITSFGIGEAPLYRQATFSVWESLEDVKAFAYRSREHAEVIRKTRAENWYSEELFARFKPVATFGTIRGIDPLKNHIKN
jgi:heme-degrading monooxygenase HmoA